MDNPTNRTEYAKAISKFMEIDGFEPIKTGQREWEKELYLYIRVLRLRVGMKKIEGLVNAAQAIKIAEKETYPTNSYYIVDYRLIDALEQALTEMGL